MIPLWDTLPALAQDTLIFAGGLAAPALLGWLICRGYALRPLLSGLLRRYFWTNLVFVMLVAVSVGLGVGLLAQERGLRQASARIANKFDLIISAPGDEVSMLMASVFLQATDAPLLDGATYNAIATADHVALAAPLAYGDSFHGMPVIGSTAAFVNHLSGGLAQGDFWQTPFQAVIGAQVPLRIGDSFAPAHGHGAAAEQGAHEGVSINITGVMAPTGSPWDKAIIVPVESVWRTHGLADGHAPGNTHLGPPFDADYFPGTPAVIVKPDAIYAAYGLQAQFSTEDTMAFFPGAVLTRLHGLMGDMRAVMSVMALVTQVLVATAVVAGLTVLARLFARRLALLRAIGAPVRMVFALVWSYAATLLGLGGVFGLAVGFVAVQAISKIISARTDLLLTPKMGWPEFHLVAGFLGLASIVALLPAAVALLRPIVADLRQ